MTKLPNFPVAYHDFYKTNGGDYVFNTVGPSLTRQEFAEECDINALMKRYDAVGTGPGGLPGPVDRVPMYVDFVNTPDDLLGYLNLMKEAEAAFMTLPAIVRKEFDNDAVAFVDYAADPNNLEQMRAWGLAPPAKPAPAAPEAAPGAASSSPASQAAAAPGASPAPAPGASTHA